MALLKYEELKAAIETEELDDRLVVMPLLDRERQIGPASVDVRLGTQFRLLRGIEGPGIDPAHELDPLLTRSEERVSLPFGAHPGQFVLGATLEYLRFPPHLGGYVVGRSSWVASDCSSRPRSWCSRGSPAASLWSWSTTARARSRCTQAVA